MFSVVSLLLMIGTLASAQVTVNQSCDQNITVFPITVALGIVGTTYYEQRRYPFIYEEDSRCNTATFSILNLADLDPSDLSKLLGKVVFSQIYTNGTAWTLEGSTVFPEPLLAKVDITIDGFPGPASLSVVAVDDDLSYGVVYSCTDLGNGSSIQYIWIVTKEVNPPSSLVDEAITAIQRLNIDTTPLIQSNQTNCG